ncbi:MAG: hypothetical protein AB7N99_00120 [Simkaniaceae bacterium]
MKRLTILLTLFCFSLFATGKEPAAKTTYIYTKDVDGYASKSQWIIEEKEGVWHMNGESPGGKTLVIASPTQINTQSFTYQSKNEPHQYAIHREGNTLLITQEINGKKLEKSLSLEGDTWVQEFDFSFKPFILANHSDFKFSIVHPQKLSLHQMVASKQGLDQIDIDGKIFTALKVKVTLRGFKKMFWHADLWFEQDSGDLLRYKANDGPNTPTSIITLFSKHLD